MPSADTNISTDLLITLELLKSEHACYWTYKYVDVEMRDKIEANLPARITEILDWPWLSSLDKDWIIYIFTDLHALISKSKILNDPSVWTTSPQKLLTALRIITLKDGYNEIKEFIRDPKSSTTG